MTSLRRERSLRSWPPFRGMGVAEVVNHNVECGEEGVQIDHEESVPFPSGSVSKPTLAVDTFRSNLQWITHTKRKGDRTDGTESHSQRRGNALAPSAISTGIMRPVEGGYIYNLRVPTSIGSVPWWPTMCSPSGFVPSETTARGEHVRARCLMKIRK